MIPRERVERSILLIRSHKVMLDSDLAELYGVSPKRLNESVRRNIRRFPPDFMFQLKREESDSLRSQFATLKTGRGRHRKYLPYAFTEQGVAMLSSVLNSERAVEVNIQIIRAFVRLRKINDTRYARQSVPSDKARIIFFRESDANYRSVTLDIDGETIGKLAAGGFLVEDTTPGPHRIVASVSLTPGEYGAKLNAQAGEIYYIKASNRDERTLYGFLGAAGTFLTFADNKGFFRLRLVDPTAALVALEELQLSE